MKNSINITILVDNQADLGFKSEHGYAVLIEHNNKRILFDTGQGYALFYNAEKLKIKLTELDAIILSHGHYDHGGNIEWLLANNPASQLYLPPDCLQTRYSILPENRAKDISLSTRSMQAIKNFAQKQVTITSEMRQITSIIYLSGEIDKQQPIEQYSGPFYLDKQQKKRDPLSDDQCLWIKTKQGIVILTGCCHAGIENSVKQIQKQANTKNIHSILGGLHLHNATTRRIQHSTEFLTSLQLKKLYPAHCSGESAQIQLQHKLGADIVQQSKVGLTLNYTD